MNRGALNVSLNRDESMSSQKRKHADAKQTRLFVSLTLHYPSCLSPNLSETKNLLTLSRPIRSFQPATDCTLGIHIMLTFVVQCVSFNTFCQYQVMYCSLWPGSCKYLSIDLGITPDLWQARVEFLSTFRVSLSTAMTTKDPPCDSHALIPL